MLLFVFSICLLSPHSLGGSINRFRRQANGCGPVNLNIDILLKEIGEHVLIECCNEHDLCYDQCGKAQLTCDTTFLHCMIEACQQLLLSSNINRCQNDARILFWFVFVGGRSAYEQAQQEHYCTILKQETNNTSIETVK
ncbi:unnamed protein product [Rotaria magnacalcarata]|uniref:Group XIIA secretory phospholipase A2 n=1 Tax=Rotaria magnacalcarata TaxID=392030 RepID=A0A819ZCE1_9BILA|nr:unnamed protein product [Rotaria magnacalcarata]CAF1553957.1 unnamed protein product [Rotaria magnacalcarata]CAF2048077.1 unnamed protein product [Rotaria magnacalcarata]CAF2093234.1 unnamed protein product [Rotaria magnacalcarata]CAF2118923.1 unnamed protein product [Rotaria magnacalcarata]